MKNRPLFLLMWATVCLTPLLLLSTLLFRMPQPLNDFDSYWAAGHLFLGGLHPYSITQMMHLEQQIGSKRSDPMIMLCPPWTLPLFALEGGLSFHLAHLLWLATSIVLDLLSALGLWLYFGGSRRGSWIALVIVATFIPLSGTEYLGQISPLILFCLTAFLLLTQRQRYFLAGMCLFGLGIKPHLTYLVFLAVLAWILRERRWAVLAGALTISSACMLGAVMYNPLSLDYFHNGFHVAIGNVSAIGGVLRSIFGMQRRWLQFLPSVLGAGWLFWYLRRHRSDWNWQRDFPLLILVSVSTAAYGWYIDFILILPALIAIAARGAYRSGVAIFCYAAIQFMIVNAFLLPGPNVAWVFTLGLLWIPLYLSLSRSLSKHSTTLHARDRVAVS